MNTGTPWGFALRAAGVGLIVLSGIIVSDALGLFQPKPDSNPHVEKRWAALKELRDAGIELDVLVVGNSHAYTGINPKHLSTELGLNAFVLANNGTNWADSEWMIRHVLEMHTPQCIVLETFGFDHSHAGMDNEVHFVDQMRAYRARNGGKINLNEALDLFHLSSLPFVLSPTLLNHHFLWTQPEWVAENFERKGPIAPPKTDELYLGRFVRFMTGIEDTLLTKYAKDGPQVDGSALTFSDENLAAGARIAELCAERGIDLFLLSLPMYEGHVEHMDDWTERREAAWANAMPGVQHWDFQAISDLASQPSYFENTYKPNQHMSYNGSIAATGYLAERLRENTELPSRLDDPEWHTLFRNQEGYYCFHRPTGANPAAKLWAADVQVGELQILDVATFPIQKGKAQAIQFKLQPHVLPDQMPRELKTRWLLRNSKDSVVQRVIIPIERAPHASRSAFVNYQKFIQADVELLQVESVWQ